jgi:hypothetical protein
MIRQLMIGIIVLIVLTVAPVTETRSATERYNVDQDHSIVGFSIANWVVSKTTSRSTDYTGPYRNGPGWLWLFAWTPAVAAPLASEEQAASQHHEHVAATPHDHMHGTLPASGMSPEEDLEYSRFMHHSSGVALLVLGSLLLMDRWTARKHRLLRVGVGGTWLVLGAFLFIFSDLEDWPIGPVGFRESFSLPTAHEWIQHHLLAMIPMVLGIYAMLSHRTEARPLWRYLAVGLAVLGGAGLMIHQHLDHPSVDFVNVQHRLFALTSFFIAGSLAVEGSGRFAWRGKPYLLPVGLLLLGIQLAIYVE